MCPSRVLSTLALFIVATTSIALAQNRTAEKSKAVAVRGNHAWMTTLSERPQNFTRPNIQNAGLVTIFSNLATTYPNGLYWCCTGYNVMGPNSGAGVQWMAAAFTPDANHTVTQIDVGAGYSQQGTNGIVVSLNLDRNGKPGKALKKWVASGLPSFGTCCGLVTVSDNSGIQVNGGQQYWIVLSTNKSETDTVDGWNVDDTDQVNMSTLASYSGTKWYVFQASPGVAFAVSGSN